MRAITYDRTGPAADVLTLRKVPEPAVGPNDVLVRIAASGINPADVKRRAGWGGMIMQHDRVIPHCDGAGTIAAVGQSVDPMRVGQRVWLWNAQGGYGEAGRAEGTAAEWIALPQAQAVPLADHYSFAQGACLGVPAMTAFRCVMSDGPVSGHCILVQGGGGAVGYLAVQIALAEGARVLTTVSDDAVSAKLLALGAEPIDRHREDVQDRVLTLTDGAGVDRLIEVDFGANQTLDASLVKTNGVIASFSSTSNARPVLDYYAFASKGLNLRFIQGFALPQDTRDQGQVWLASHQIDIPIAKTFALGECAQAHMHIEQGGKFGQTVLLL